MKPLKVIEQIKPHDGDALWRCRLEQCSHEHWLCDSIWLNEKNSKVFQLESNECDANSSFSSFCTNFNREEKINVFDSHVVLLIHGIALGNVWVMIPSTTSKVQIAQPTHGSRFFNNVSIVNCNFTNGEDLKNFLCLSFVQHLFQGVHF